jgi:hypothetical protein
MDDGVVELTLASGAVFHHIRHPQHMMRLGGEVLISKQGPE